MDGPVHVVTIEAVGSKTIGGSHQTSAERIGSNAAKSVTVGICIIRVKLDAVVGHPVTVIVNTIA